MADLKITLRDLYGLHFTSLDREHAIRKSDDESWRTFPPTRFVYAFFTFNSIYGYDWAASFPANEPREWQRIQLPNNKSERMSESKQFYGLVDFYYAKLGPDAPKLFATSLSDMISLLAIADPADKLTRIDTTNELPGTEKLRKAFPSNFAAILHPEHGTADPAAALKEALHFIYKVRCNIFHGSKTTIQMADLEQQSRLLIYTTVLIATNGLLFEVVDRLPTVGRNPWVRPDVNWAS